MGHKYTDREVEKLVHDIQDVKNIPARVRMSIVEEHQELYRKNKKFRDVAIAMGFTLGETK